MDNYSCGFEDQKFICENELLSVDDKSQQNETNKKQIESKEANNENTQNGKNQSLKNENSNAEILAFKNANL